MNKSDKILINTTLFVIFFVIMYVAVKNFAAAVFIAFLLWVTANRILVHLLNRRKNTKKITVTQMEDRLALIGIKGQTEFFAGATPPCFDPVAHDGYITMQRNCEPIMICPNYKYSPCSPDEIAKYYRQAKEVAIKKVFVLSRLNPRSLFLFATRLDVEFEFVPSRKIHRFLYRQNLLMAPLPKPAKKKKLPSDKKEIFSNIFTRKRSKYFFASGFALAFLCLFSPFKIYYLVMSVLALGLGLVCVIREKI